MYCPKCGEVIDDSDIFCRKCGYRIINGKDNINILRKRKIYIIVGLIFCSMVIVVGAVYLQKVNEIEIDDEDKQYAINTLDNDEGEVQEDVEFGLGSGYEPSELEYCIQDEMINKPLSEMYVQINDAIIYCGQSYDELYLQLQQDTFLRNSWFWESIYNPDTFTESKIEVIKLRSTLIKNEIQNPIVIIYLDNPDLEIRRIGECYVCGVQIYCPEEENFDCWVSGGIKIGQTGDEFLSVDDLESEIIFQDCETFDIDKVPSAMGGSKKDYVGFNIDNGYGEEDGQCYFRTNFDKNTGRYFIDLIKF